MWSPHLWLTGQCSHNDNWDCSQGRSSSWLSNNPQPGCPLIDGYFWAPALMIHPTLTVRCHHSCVTGDSNSWKIFLSTWQVSQGAWLKAWMQQLLLLWSVRFYSGSSALLRTWRSDPAHFFTIPFQTILPHFYWAVLKRDLCNGTLGQRFILFKRLDKRLVK